ncbi:MAG: helix-turn-helix domain-containing protein [Verrucomicrobiota bacterium]
MEGSIGNALRTARLQKKITVEEAARATRMRSDRILDLENDDYTKFAGLAYARSFLVLYAKFLEVDVSKFHTMEVGNSAGVGDYQYLQNEKGVNTLRFAHQVAKAKPRWLRRVVVFTVMLCFGAIVGSYVMNVWRLGILKGGSVDHVDQIVKQHQSGDQEALTSPAPTPVPAERQDAASTTEAAPSAAPSVTLSQGDPVPTGLLQEGVNALPAQPLAGGTIAAPVPAPTEPGVRRAEPVGVAESGAPVEAPSVVEPPAATPVPVASAIPVSTPTPIQPLREVTIRVTKRTKLTIIRDDPNSKPIYDDRRSSGMAPLTFRGRHFWIKAADRNAVKVSVAGGVPEGTEAPVEFE